MNKTRDRQRQTQSQERSADRGATLSLDIPAAVGFTPRRGLFIFLSLVLIALFAGMLGLYFKTVYPNRNGLHVVEKDSPTGVVSSPR